MKQPKPWFWTARKAWYVQLGGKQIRLHEIEKEANKAFFRLMASEGRAVDAKSARMTVADIVESCITAAEHHRPSTVRLYRDMLGPFAAHFRAKRLADLTPSEIIRFVSGYQGTGYKGRAFSDSTRYLMFRYVKTLYRWARDTGLIEINQLHGTDNPWKSMARPRAMTEPEYLAIMHDRKIHDKAKELMEYLWRTGARPGEIAIVEARHLDARLPIVRLQPTEHKTGTKTGLQREIFVPPDLMDKLRAYAHDRPKGTLLRDRFDQPWTTASISNWFGCAKRRLKLPKDLVIYMARHAFITRHLGSGQPAALVAKLAGHTHAETIQRVYYHPDTDAMMGIVGAGADEQRRAIDEIRAKVELERLKHRSSLISPPDEELPYVPVA
jgi:integrase